MMLIKIKNSIPNILTLGNLLSGCLGVVCAFQQQLEWSAYLIGIAAVFDFLDGFVARLINAKSEIGGQLDSLADMVTFGVLPGVIMFQLISISLGDYFTLIGDKSATNLFLESLGLLITLFSALRLAIFNVSEDQTDKFIGMPTPSIAILVASFPLMLNYLGFNFYLPLQETVYAATAKINYWMPLEELEVSLLQNTSFLVVSAIVMALMLVAPIEMLALKFKGKSWENNKSIYVFLIICVVILIWTILPFFLYVDWIVDLDFLAITLIITLYAVYSVINNLIIKKQ